MAGVVLDLVPSVVLGVDRAVLTFSTLVPFRQLGQVTLIAIVTAVIASTMLLPSLLVLVERARTRRPA